MPISPTRRATPGWKRKRSYVREGRSIGDVAWSKHFAPPKALSRRSTRMNTTCRTAARQQPSRTPWDSSRRRSPRSARLTRTPDPNLTLTPNQWPRSARPARERGRALVPLFKCLHCILLRADHHRQHAARNSQVIPRHRPARNAHGARRLPRLSPVTDAALRETRTTRPVAPTAVTAPRTTTRTTAGPTTLLRPVLRPPFGGGCVTCYSRPEQLRGTLKYHTVFSSPPAGSGTHSKVSHVHSERFFFASGRVNTY
eukprot:scaffold18767_cov54-Phaeocystis_antarctica.AAC.4